jgi:ribosomal biogenesis protein LAS1
VDNGDNDDDGDEEEPEPREAWALDRLCDALLVKGALVPISRKKRVSSKGSPHHPPSSLLMIWTPLLESVAAEHPHFPAVLTSHVIAHLLSNDDDNAPADEPEPVPDDNTKATTAAAAAAEKASYDVCLANWGTWLIEWRRSDDETDADVTARRQSVFFQLAQSQVLVTPNHKHEQEETSSPKSQTQTGARALLNALCASDRRFAGMSEALMGVDTRRASENDPPVWCETDLDVMEARVKSARSLSTPQSDVNAATYFSPAEQVSLSQNKSLPSGWRMLSEQGGWRTCPIGVYV